MPLLVRIGTIVPDWVDSIASLPFRTQRTLCPQSNVVNPREFNQTVVPISGLKFFGLGVEGKLGTGLCPDPNCRFIETKYHVAVTARPPKSRGKESSHGTLLSGRN